MAARSATDLSVAFAFSGLCKEASKADQRTMLIEFRRRSKALNLESKYTAGKIWPEMGWQQYRKEVNTIMKAQAYDVARIVDLNDTAVVFHDFDDVPLKDDSGRPLHTYLGQLSKMDTLEREEFMLGAAAQLIQTGAQLHQGPQRAHLNLSLDNIRVMQSGDGLEFGVSNFVASQPLSQGTHPSGYDAQYMPPEVLYTALAQKEGVPLGRQALVVDGAAIDTFSIGVLLFVLAIGHLPFRSETKTKPIRHFSLQDLQNRCVAPHPQNMEDIHIKQQSWAEAVRQAVIYGEPIAHQILTEVAHVSSTPRKAVDFFTRMLHPDPQQRMTLVEAYAHPYLQEAVQLLELRTSSSTAPPSPAKTPFTDITNLPEKAARGYVKGETVWYLPKKDGKFVGTKNLATIKAVDRSVSPASFGVQLDGTNHIKETESARLQHMRMDGDPTVTPRATAHSWRKVMHSMRLPVPLPALNPAPTTTTPPSPTVLRPHVVEIGGKLYLSTSVPPTAAQLRTYELLDIACDDDHKDHDGVPHTGNAVGTEDSTSQAAHSNTDIFETDLTGADSKKSPSSTTDNTLSITADSSASAPIITGEPTFVEDDDSDDATSDRDIKGIKSKGNWWNRGLHFAKKNKTAFLVGTATVIGAALAKRK